MPKAHQCILPGYGSTNCCRLSVTDSPDYHVVQQSNSFVDISDGQPSYLLINIQQDSYQLYSNNVSYLTISNSLPCRIEATRQAMGRRQYCRSARERVKKSGNEIKINCSVEILFMIEVSYNTLFYLLCYRFCRRSLYQC